MTTRTGNPARIVLSLVTASVAWNAAPVMAQQAGQAAAQAREHVVKRGDTLWDLARFYLTNPFLWPVIHKANLDVVEDPHWIYPGERLKIPGVESGLPVAVQTDTGRAEVPPPIPEAQPQVEQRGPVAIDPGPRSRFYTPPPPVDAARATDLRLTREPLYAVPPAEYLSAAWLSDTANVSVRGRLMGLADPATQRDKLPVFLHPYDRVQFTSLRGEPLQVGDSMLVARFEAQVGTMGRMIVPVALVRVDSIGPDVMSAKVIRQYAITRAGDYLIPMDRTPEIGRGMPQPVMNGEEGTLVAFLEREPLYGTMDNGFIDMGEDAGLRIGDELIAYVPPRPALKKNVTLPAEAVATLRVVKVRGSSATVRVGDASSTTLQPGLLVRVVRKMP